MMIETLLGTVIGMGVFLVFTGLGLIAFCLGAKISERGRDE